MATAVIYIITSTESGRAYIGSTAHLRKRWREHRNALRGGYHVNPHLQAAWDLYGEATFEFGILEHLENTEGLHLAEQFWMDVYREENTELYNMGPCADNAARGRPMSEEHKHRISKANKGRRHSIEHTQKAAAALRGRSMSPEARANMSKAQTGHLCSPQTRAKIAASLQGHGHSEGRRRNQSSAQGKPYPAFHNLVTGETIPAGQNLRALCREQGLISTCMYNVVKGKQRAHCGWTLAAHQLPMETDNNSNE